MLAEPVSLAFVKKFATTDTALLNRKATPPPLSHGMYYVSVPRGWRHIIRKS